MHHLKNFKKFLNEINKLSPFIENNNLDLNLNELLLISQISELKEIQNAHPPKRSKRRQKSDKNTISLDI